jgi:hypothetical protein
MIGTACYRGRDIRSKPTTVLTHKRGRNTGRIARVPDEVRKPHLMALEQKGTNSESIRIGIPS